MIKKLFKMVNLGYFRFFKSGVDYARHLGVKVGNNCRIYTSSFGSEPFLISIGNNVTITSGVKLITHDGSGWLFRDERGRRYIYRPIKIGDNVFIGVNSILLPGVLVENDVIIAAGSVVTKSIPADSIVAGNPAKIIGRYSALRSKMLASYVADSDLDRSVDYKNMIEKVVDEHVRPFLTRGVYE